MDIILDGNLVGIINGLIPQVVFYSSEAVVDEVRGYLVYDNAWSFVGVKQYGTYWREKQCKKLALILESPHKCEYNGRIPLRPANGNTGKNINTKLINRSFINSLDYDFDYEVMLINPVQLQCSCYNQGNNIFTSNRTGKNNVFKCLFDCLKYDFHQRLISYKPDFILNCTTYDLKKVVENAICGVRQVGSDATDKHPSSW